MGTLYLDVSKVSKKVYKPEISTRWGFESDAEENYNLSQGQDPKYVWINFTHEIDNFEKSLIHEIWTKHKHLHVKGNNTAN